MTFPTAKAALIAGIFTAFMQPALAEEAKSQCETDNDYKAFDFWVGDWTVRSANSGKMAGTNKITKVENGCALLEDWKGIGGSTGKSLNYYDPNKQAWRQVWVSAGGYTIDIEGGMKDGSMVLEGLISYFQNGIKAPFRGTWTPRTDGTVRQFFEQFDKDSDSWKPWFDGIYAPADAPN